MDSALPPIHAAHLFPALDAALVQLLKSLGRDEWRAPTIVPGWNVHQVTAHLLDTALRRLSMCRDEWRLPLPPPTSERQVVELINALNAQGVVVYGALSPEVLIALTEVVTPQLASYLASLDPLAPAAFAVSWAGESESQNWFDIARELTERWHHQQQIRLATNRPGLMTPVLYGPVLETFMRVLPHTYRHVEAPDGSLCDVVVPGECGGHWRIMRRADRWVAVASTDAPPLSKVIVPPDLAWRLLTKGATRDEALARVVVHGDQRLGQVFLDALAIVG